MSESDSSNYMVEDYIRPKKVTAKIRNNEDEDILGNFNDPEPVPKSDDEISEDDSNDGRKRRKPRKGREEIEFDSDEEEKKIIYKEIKMLKDDEDEDSEEEENENEKTGSENEINDLCDGPVVKKPRLEKEDNYKLTEAQLKKLQSGVSKVNRFVLYVTNLTADTTKEMLQDLFSKAGNVKSIRIPKIRKSNYAFVEMKDEKSFKDAFNLHNQQLNGKQIKIQMSEAGKKKSSNKKNIMKQKNRVLAEMRNESKFFLKSGKSFSHTNCGKKRMKDRAIALLKSNKKK